METIRTFLEQQSLLSLFLVRGGSEHEQQEARLWVRTFLRRECTPN